jgi:hypothetical protein
MPDSVLVPLSDTMAAAEDEHTQQQHTLIQCLLVTVQHFFGGFQRLFAHITDPRHPAFITYPLACVLTTGVLMFLLRLGARRQINLMLRQNGPSSAKFHALFRVALCPHGDTLDETCKRLQVLQVQDVVTGAVENLIRKKMLDRYRRRGRYLLVVMDGTGVLTFSERHCPHCLTVTHNGHTTYYHPILEAKLVTHDGFVFSLLTEFIENPGEHPTKQDGEPVLYRTGTGNSRPSTAWPVASSAAFPACRFVCSWTGSSPVGQPSRSVRSAAGSTSSSCRKTTYPSSKTSSTAFSMPSPKTTSAFGLQISTRPHKTSTG